MTVKLSKYLFYIIISALFSQNSFAAEKMPVFVSIVPQKFFVQQIGKELVTVHVMVRPGASPATYEPRPRQMAALTKTSVYFAIGVPFEKMWLKRIAAANPEMKVVHTDEGITKVRMDSHGHPGAAHEQHAADAHDEHHQGQAGLDPHIWLSPPLVKIQARTILKALVEIDPDNRDTYMANFIHFAAEIDRLDSDLRKIFNSRQGTRFMVFHPSWGYFARTYGLRQVPLEIEGKKPKPAQLKELIEQAREKGLHVIFVQPQFSTRSAALVAREIGGRVAFANPLAEDWMTNLRHVAAKFEMAVK